MVRRFAVGIAAAALACSGLALAAPAASAATFEVTSGADDGSEGTFRWAVTQAGTNPGNDVVNVAASVTAITLDDCVAGRVEIAPTGLLTVSGNGTTITQTCAGEGVLGGIGDTTLNDLTLTGGDSAGNGGAIELNGGLILDGVTVTGNTAALSGGGIFTVDATINDSVISDNAAGDEGGGIFSFGVGALTIATSTIQSNTAAGTGGGIAGSGAVILTESAVLENDANAAGGIAAVGDLSITDSEVTLNTATSNGGGAIGAGDAAVTVTDSTVADNTAGGYIGGVGGVFVEVSIIGSTVAGNESGSTAGGVAGDSVTIIRSAVTGNSAIGTAGGVASGESLSIESSTIADNVASIGGGVATEGPADLSFATVVGNGPSNLALGGATNIFGSVIAISSQDCDLSDGGTVVSQGYNFGGDASCGFTGTGDKSAAGDPMLSELGLHDGTTENSLPLSGSPLLNTIPTSNARCSGTDQRGFARPANGACDTGAVEIRQVSAVSLAVSTPYQTSVVTDLVPLVTDPDGVLAVYEVEGAVNGFLDAADGGIVTYTPDAGFSGVDSYTYIVCSFGDVICAATQTITVTVGPGPAAIPVTVQPTFTG